MFTREENSVHGYGVWAVEWNGQTWSGICCNTRHRQLKRFVQDLNHIYRSEPALHNQDFQQAGFEWIDCSDNRQVLRYSQSPGA